MRRIALTALAVLVSFTGPALANATGDAVPAAHSPADAKTAEAPASAAIATPSIERLHASLLDLMQNAETLGYNGRVEKIRPVVDDVFDMQFMASKSISRHWKKLSPEDQGRWLDVFARHIAANYAGQFTGFTGESFETLGEEEARSGTRVVRTRLTRPSDDPVQLNYRLREVDGEWRIIDIFLNGTVSELALRRSEYASVLKREGFESLVQIIADKCQELEEGGSAS